MVVGKFLYPSCQLLVMLCSTRWTKANKKPVVERTLLVDELEEGAEYKFRVMAENAAGVGEPCEPITIVAKDPFGEHTILLSPRILRVKFDANISYVLLAN